MCGDNLNGLAKVLAAAFLVEDVPVDLAGREVGEFIQVFVDEALVVAKVKVGLCAVFCHIHFAVLVRAHGARINVDVRVELLCGDLQSSRLQKTTERCRRNALAEAGNHAAGYENVLCHRTYPFLFYSETFIFFFD